MGNAVVYEVTNIMSGEKFVGTASDIAQRFRLSTSYVNKLALEGKRINLDWKIVRLDQRVIVEKPNNHSIPYTLQEEWDKVTAPFKRLAERKASRA